MRDDLVPACGGQEKPFTVNGRRWLYCWQRSTGRHCYLDVDQDLPVWNREFHPAFTPELEHVTDEELEASRRQAREAFTRQRRYEHEAAKSIWL